LSCRFARPPRGTRTPADRRALRIEPPLLERLLLTDLRGYRALELELGPGPHLVHGPNAAGKTSLLEAIFVLASGHSHRTPTDAEMIRWGADVARVEGVIDGGSAGGGSTVEVALLRNGGGGQRKRIRVNGVPRRATSLAGTLRVVFFAPEEMLLIAGSPGLRRTALDGLVSGRSPVYAADLATYGRALQQRNSLLRAIREEQATREQLRFWDTAVLESGASVVSARLALLEAIAEPLGAAHREIAPEEGRLILRYETNAPARPGESIHDALARRLAETAEKEVWNGSTLIGPHRDDLVFELDQDGVVRNLAGFASRGQQRTAILALKLAELDLLTELDGRPPLLLLDDVFSELDPDRRSHLVRRIAALPQALITTTTLDDLDPALRARATSWAVETGPGGAALVGEQGPG
jgi:DNA replication and repair protein RecF